MESFENLLTGSAKAHGHLCPGQVVGVRMAMLGCQLIGLENSRTLPQIKKLIVYVEMDRCASDAVMAVTGCRVGKRTVKIMDYGIMAATFVNLETGKAVRVRARESSRGLASRYAPYITEKYDQQREAYKVMPLSEMFEVSKVHVEIKESDMPGPAGYKTTCEECGIVIRDAKEVFVDEKVLCHYCAGAAYYKKIESIPV